MRARGPKVLPLRCEECGGVLHGTPQAVLFVCGTCRACVEVVGDRFVSRRSLTAKPWRRGAGQLVHLPFWGLRVRAAWEWVDAVRTRTAGWEAPDWVFVTAFALSNAFYFGDPGLIFTQKRLAFDAGEPASVCGGTRSVEEAKIFVEPHLLSLLDRRADVTGLTMSVVIDETVLWAVPYYDDGTTLEDGLVGCTLPGAALDEIGALRSWWRRVS